VAVTKKPKPLTPSPEAPAGAAPVAAKKPSKAEKTEKAQKLVENLKSTGELATTVGLEQRREQVYRLYLMGIPYEVIGQTFGVSESTVKIDLKAVTETLAEGLIGIGAIGVVARAFHRYEHLKAEAARLYHGLDDKEPLKSKMDALYLLKELEDSQLRMVMTVGAVPKAQKFAVREEAAGHEGEEFTPEQARSVMRDIIELVKNDKGTYEPNGKPAKVKN